jgi:hypothetical protein
MVHHDILDYVPNKTKGTHQGSKETLAQGSGPALVHSERRLYETNEETSTSFRDGISN